MSTNIESMTPLFYRVTRIWREIPLTYSMEMIPVDDTQIVSFAAGQFNMLYVFGVGEIPISISGNPLNHKTLIHTVRAVGCTSQSLSMMRPGAMVGVRGPFGSVWPLQAAYGKDIVIVAGGIGLAPLRPALYQMIEERDRFGNVTVLLGARTPDELLYPGEFDVWRKAGIEIALTVDKAKESWHGSVGVVTRLIPRVRFDPDNTVAMVCGPEIMIRFTATELVKHGMSADQIFISLERSMQCGIGLCGHCQFGPHFICKDGPIFVYQQVKDLLRIREI